MRKQKPFGYGICCLRRECPAVCRTEVLQLAAMRNITCRNGLMVKLQVIFTPAGAQLRKYFDYYFGGLTSEMENEKLNH